MFFAKEIEFKNPNSAFVGLELLHFKKRFLRIFFKNSDRNSGLEKQLTSSHGYFKVSIIRPGLSRLLEFGKKKIVLVV